MDTSKDLATASAGASSGIGDDREISLTGLVLPVGGIKEAALPGLAARTSA